MLMADIKTDGENERKTVMHTDLKKKEEKNR